MSWRQRWRPRPLWPPSPPRRPRWPRRLSPARLPPGRRRRPSAAWRRRPPAAVPRTPAPAPSRRHSCPRTPFGWPSPGHCGSRPPSPAARRPSPGRPSPGPGPAPARPWPAEGLPLPGCRTRTRTPLWPPPASAGGRRLPTRPMGLPVPLVCPWPLPGGVVLYSPFAWAKSTGNWTQWLASHGDRWNFVRNVPVQLRIRIGHQPHRTPPRRWLLVPMGVCYRRPSSHSRWCMTCALWMTTNCPRFPLAQWST
mmetsp:Transcript_7863/g.15102  ORF Transcript_7863/g.15102 Transcript_7863/m.15102 type:complete len:252 (+) Transcript_7863:1754-2509(+)